MVQRSAAYRLCRANHPSTMIYSNMNKTARVLHDVAATTLAHLSIGTEARVISVSGVGALARRLLEMGVVPGTPVRVVKAAPLGDPLEVRVRNCHIALRRNEAATIAVQPA